MSDEYSLIVSFPDQSETFVLGFEAGQCFERLGRGDTSDITMHSANQEVFLRIARHYKVSVEFTPAPETNGAWLVAAFTRDAKPKLRSVCSSTTGAA